MKQEGDGKGGGGKEDGENEIGKFRNKGSKKKRTGQQKKMGGKKSGKEKEENKKGWIKRKSRGEKLG